MKMHVISWILYFPWTVTHFWVVAHQLRNAYLVISSKELYKVLVAQEVG